ncbi:aldo/keto reductase [Aureimonas jatrophae]|uniref:Predicted oxidoreductase n=1 Tax=Aureimonas jatrophae TaxID=1166073 RepID=A0A1H0IKT6_9HYPH|nr:aldo/keto reductase [Aureimonas jatrophae]MBB3952214.1 aryl-alcohol dehydrogenase-like predicted oxidoreductase [Aureimonas jatrophae]SDO31651.1 Predicted oxidoreductase [Aureimonas jatrophae]
MQKRPLGRTGLQVGRISLGTMTFGEQNTEAEAHRQLDRAVERGVDLLDTAELYPIPPKAKTQGATERFIGSWLRESGKRDKVLVATKVVGRSDSRWFRDDGSKPRLDRRNIEEAADKSLARLGIETIDLYQVHWPDRPTSGFGAVPTRWKSPAPDADEVPIEETMEALAALVTSGKVRYVGLSNESGWGTMRYLAASERGLGPRVHSIQNAYNLLNRTFETALAEIALREDVGLLAYSPLAQGFLTGKYANGALPEGSRKALFDRQQRYERPGAAEAVDAYVRLAAEFGLHPATFANAFVINQPFVTATILGATSVEQLDRSLDAEDVLWTDEMQAAVDTIHQRVGNPAP